MGHESRYSCEAYIAGERAQQRQWDYKGRRGNGRMVKALHRN
jgi:hypothetical protein